MQNNRHSQELTDLCASYEAMDATAAVETSTSSERTEQRAIIKFCVRAGMSPTETWKFLNPGDGLRKCSRTIVFDWHKRFRDCRDDVSDNKRSGRPHDSESIDKVRRVISVERRKSIDDIADRVALSHGNTFN